MLFLLIYDYIAVCARSVI